jgi:hypothetical protein
MTLWRDVTFAVRLLVKDRWFTAAAVTALALGIGVNAMSFTLVNAILLRSAPIRDPDRLMEIQSQWPGAAMGTRCPTSRIGNEPRAPSRA